MKSRLSLVHEKWPRHYLDEIICLKTKKERNAAIKKNVPEHLQGMVRTHVKNFIEKRDFMNRANTPKGGELSKLAGMWCTNPKFWVFLNTHRDDVDGISNKEDAADYIRKYCGVSSRAEIDHVELAKRKFNGIRKAWSKWND